MKNVFIAIVLLFTSAPAFATTFVRVTSGHTTDICYGPDITTAVSQAFANDYITSVGGLAAWLPIKDGVAVQDGATVTISNGTITGAVNPPAPAPIMGDAAIDKAAFQTLYAAHGGDLAATLSAWPQVQK